MVTNPIYGAYAYGKTSAVPEYSGSAVGTKSRRKPRAEWLGLKLAAREGYLDRERAEAIRRMVSERTSRQVGIMVRLSTATPCSPVSSLPPLRMQADGPL
jgi:hypothetical protein